MSTSAICMSTADASSGCAAFSCLSSTISRVSARGGRGGRSDTLGIVVARQEGRREGFPCRLPTNLERQSEAEPCDARADPVIGIPERRSARVDHGGANAVVDDPLVVQVEQIQIDAHLPP